MSVLLVERGNLKRKRIELTKFPFYIGRDLSNDLVLEDELCSRKHLRFKNRGRIVILEDLDSHNGTFVNGDRIVNTVLQSGDKILLGRTEFRYIASSTQIQVANEIAKYDMVIADELGFNKTGLKKGSDDLGLDLKKWRLPELNVLKLHGFTAESYKEIFDTICDITLTEDFTETIERLLKSIGNVTDVISRIAFFVWSNPNQELFPVAVRHFTKKKSFLLSRRCMQDVLERKRAIFLKDITQDPKITYSGRNRLILPVIFQQNIVGIVHIESDEIGAGFTQHELDYIQVLLDKIASYIQSMLLKRDLDVWFTGALETMVAVVEAKDTYTRGHSERVSKYCMAIAEELKLDPEVRKILMMSALVHDIGKIGIPDAILKKASNLSGDEYEDMKLHPLIGAEILRHIPGSQRFVSGVKHHHEKWNGTGYPDGLSGEEIPFFARIIAIADTFDAMVSGRSYSGFIDQATALDKIRREKDIFDPEILKAFLKAYDDGLLTMKTDTQNNELPEELRSSGTLVKKSKSKTLSVNKDDVKDDIKDKKEDIGEDKKLDVDLKTSRISSGIKEKKGITREVGKSEQFSHTQKTSLYTSRSSRGSSTLKKIKK